MPSISSALNMDPSMKLQECDDNISQWFSPEEANCGSDSIKILRDVICSITILKLPRGTPAWDNSSQICTHIYFSHFDVLFLWSLKKND